MRKIIVFLILFAFSKALAHDMWINLSSYRLKPSDSISLTVSYGHRYLIPGGEFMKRDDLQYELGIVVEHNKEAVSSRGSCIFIHVQKAKNTGTAGCTSMSLNELKKIVNWLDEKKNPILIQIPKSSSKEILERYPELKSSELLN